MRKEIVVVHGWDPRVYNHQLDCQQVEKSIAWQNRRNLISLLKAKYSLSFFNLPGFCCVPEPDVKAFTVGDFSRSLADWLKKQPTQPGAIIGYSFGGVVALDYKVRFEKKIPVILISPALKRKESIRSSIARTGRHIFANHCYGWLKHFYQVIFSRYYRQGSLFLRTSYDLIVRHDARSLLQRVDSKEILLIYGENDQSTPVEYIEDLVKKQGINCLVIKNGGHQIGSTHPQQISKAIDEFLSE